MEKIEKIAQNKTTVLPSNARRSGTQNFLDAGKLQPQAIELEEVVLGGMMLETTAFNQVIDLLTTECFYKDAHRRIFQVMADLFQDAKPIDLLTVTNALREKGELEIVGGAYYISKLTNRVASTANIEEHARIVVQKFIMRELIKISSDTIEKAFNETTDVFDLLDKAESDLFNISESTIKKRYEKLNNIMQMAIQQIENAKQNVDGLSGIPSGFTELDKITGGWQKSDLLILAARPGMGKTSFALSIARNIAIDFQRPVAMFSLEMSAVQLVTRLIASETELSSSKLRNGNLKKHEWIQLNTRIKNLSKAKLYIDDTPALSVFELRAKCRRLIQQYEVEFIIVDYLQLMTTGVKSKGNRQEEISTISRSLKSISKELNIPIMALSQLSRAVEMRGGKQRPQLSDLRDSGAIEQDADMVMFLYRPSYYEIDKQTESTNDSDTELIIAKHRNGALKDIPLQFIAEFTKFTNKQYDADLIPEDMEPNKNFDNPVGKIMQSKLNDDKSQDGDDEPF